MNYQKLLNLIPLPSMVMLLLIGLNASAYAQDTPTIREERRKLIPVDKLITRLEDPVRDQRMQPQKVIDSLGIKKGEVVADVGAGTGYFAFRLAGTVGTEGKVYAVEIEDKLLDYIRQKMKHTGVTNIIPVKSSESDPRLPPASCDKILLANTYSYLSDPVGFMKTIRKALKPGGVVAVIDLDEDKVKEKRKKIKKKLPETSRLRFARDVTNEMKQAGFALRESHDFLDTRHFLIFSVVQ